AALRGLESGCDRRQEIRHPGPFNIQTGSAPDKLQVDCLTAPVSPRALENLLERVWCSLLVGFVLERRPGITREERQLPFAQMQRDWYLHSLNRPLAAVIPQNEI